MADREDVGRRRLHKRVPPSEIGACLPSLPLEIELVHPKNIVCLGATTGQALLALIREAPLEHARL